MIVFTKSQIQRANSFHKSLARQQKRVVELMAQGHDNAEIAKEMGLKDKTVKNHINRMIRKLKPSATEDPRGVAIMLYYAYHAKEKIEPWIP